MAFTKIKEYLSTGTGTAGTLLIPQLILPTLQAEVEKTLLDRSLAKWVLGPSQMASQGGSFNYNQVVRNTGRVREVGEGAEVPLDSLDYETVTFTFRKYGVAVRITREMMEDSQFELFKSNLAGLGRRFAENETKLVLEALDGASTTVTGGAAITIANIMTAVFNLEEDDFSPTDIICGNEVMQDLRQIDTFAEADKWGGVTTNQTGILGRVYGLNVRRFSSNAAPATTHSRRAYVVDKEEAYGIAIKRDVSVEGFMLPTYDMEGAVITQRLDVRLLRSEAVGLITTT